MPQLSSADLKPWQSLLMVSQPSPLQVPALTQLWKGFRTQISSYHPDQDPLSSLRPQWGCMVWTHAPSHTFACTLSLTSLLPHPQTYHPLSGFCMKCVPPPLALSNCPLPSDLSSKAFPVTLCEFCPACLLTPLLSFFRAAIFSTGL